MRGIFPDLHSAISPRPLSPNGTGGGGAEERLLPGAEPFTFDVGSALACLLIHGWTASPAHVRPLGEYLAARGISAYGPLLRGHGRSPEVMDRTRAEEWLEDARAALEAALARHQRAVICGHSMGGLLAILLAAERPLDPRLAGLVLLGVPMALHRDHRVRFLAPLVGCLRPIWRWHGDGRFDLVDQTRSAALVRYPRFSVRMLRELVRLERRARAALPRVCLPVLLVQARQDRTVPPHHGEVIWREIGSARKQRLWLERSGHEMVVDHEAPRLYEAVLRFCAAGGAESGLELPLEHSAAGGGSGGGGGGGDRGRGGAGAGRGSSGGGQGGGGG